MQDMRNADRSPSVLPPPPCAGCGDALGVYEPLCWLRPDGLMTVAGWLTITQNALHRHPASRFLHVGCAAPGGDAEVE